MLRRFQKARWLALLAGASPLVTFATCDRSPNGGQFVLHSSNDNLLEDAFDFVFGGDHDDDDDDD